LCFIVLLGRETVEQDFGRRDARCITLAAVQDFEQSVEYLIGLRLVG